MAEVKETNTKSLEDFSGDFAALSALLQRSWGENNQQSVLYGESFLESCFQYPGAVYSLAPTIHDAGIPIAFVVGFPRRAQLQGRELNLLLITFLTVANEYKKKGYGVMLWTELVARARKAGFDGMVNYCVAGGEMDSIILGCCGRLKLPATCVFSISYLSGLVTPVEGHEAPFCDEPAAIVDSFLQNASAVHVKEGLARLWTRPEAEWQCLHRTGAVVSRHETGGSQGVLTGYVAPIMNAKRTRCLFVEDVLWSEMDDEERCHLLQKFLNSARASGAEMATVPCAGYADLKTLSRAGFQRTRRTVRAYLTVWNGPQPTGALPEFYLDVL